MIFLVCNEIADDMFVLEIIYRHCGISSDEERQTYSNRFWFKLPLQLGNGKISKEEDKKQLSKPLDKKTC